MNYAFGLMTVILLAVILWKLTEIEHGIGELARPDPMALSPVEELDSLIVERATEREQVRYRP